MILRRNEKPLLCLLILELTICHSQNARSYDTNDWIPIAQHVIQKKAAGRVLNFPEQSRKPHASEDSNVGQTNNYQQYVPEPNAAHKQKAPNNEYVQQQPQGHILTPAELQQIYTNQHLLPNIDLITRQVLLQQQKIGQQIHPAQTVHHKYVPQQVYNQENPENLLKQSYPQTIVPQQFLLPQELHQHQQQDRRKQPQLYREQNYLQQPQLQNFQLPPIPKQESQQPQNLNYSFYDNSGIQKINDELLGVADDNYKTVDLTSTTPRAEKESVQLLYVPLEHLQQNHQTPIPIQLQKRDRQKQAVEPQKKGNLLENIEKDFVQQALQAHRLQQQFEHQNYYTPSFITPPTTTTLRPISRKRKPHQPPLAVYMNDDSGYPKVTDVLNVLKDAKTIEVQDTIGPESPHVFVGPANLDPPEGFTKFELPYLSNIESNRIERKVDQLPFFVAPLNYKAPPGYSKIPFPSPHVGSVVINKNELEQGSPALKAVPSVEDFLSPYHSIQSAPPDVTPKIERTSVRSVVQEEEPVYHGRRPSRTRGRQQNKSRTHSNIVAEQSIQSRPSVNYLNGLENLNSKDNTQNFYSGNGFSPVSSTPSSIQTNTNQPRVEINNPSINLNNQLKEQVSFDQGVRQQYQQNLQNYRNRPNEEYQTPTSSLPAKQNLQNANYYTDTSNLKPSSATSSNYKEHPSTPKQTPDFEIIPSVSTTISPFHDKDAVENFFRQFSDFSSTTPAASYFTSSKVNDQNYKHPSNENVRDIFSTTPTVAAKQITQNDRKYLPFDNQVTVPPQVNYADIIELPLGISQSSTNLPPSAVGASQALSKEIFSAQGNVGAGDYAILEEYPVRSVDQAQKVNVVAYNQQSSRPQTSDVTYEVPIRQSSHQKSRGRIHQKGGTAQTSRGRNALPIKKQAHQENYDSGIELQQSLPQNNVQQTLSDASTYQNGQEVSYSPIENPILPGLINSLEDASIRQLLAPILLAPPEKIDKSLTPSPTRAPSSYEHDQLSHTIVPSNINSHYEQETTTNPPLPSTTAPMIQVETTTQKRPRTRGRGNSRFTDRTTTNSPKRNPLKTRTQHPSRNRYRTTSTTTTRPEAYNQIRENVYSSTTEKSRQLPVRQRFKTRGRPSHTEYFSSTPKVTRIPETTTPQVLVAKEEEPKVEIHHQYYNEESAKKPQLITKSNILTPEEEYLVNKYNLQVVTTAEEPITEIINDQFLSQTTKENSPPEQYLDSSKTVNVQKQFYPSSTIAPVTADAEITTRRAAFKQTHSSNYNAGRNAAKTEHTPVKIRTRIRGSKTTQRPITTTTVKAEPLPSSLEEQRQEFYGFFRQPAFTRPLAETTLKTPSHENSLYTPILIANSPQTNVYEDEDVEINEEGIQIFSNNQQSPSTPVHFIGELLPKQSTTEKFYEATYESLPDADRYVFTSTTTEEVKRDNSRLVLNRNSKQSASRTNDIQQLEEATTKKTPTKTRGRGRTQFRLPTSVTTEQSSDNENYPQSYLDIRNQNQRHPQTIVQQPIKTQTEKSAFKITIDPADVDEEIEDDQEPHSSILRPKVLPLTNHWKDEDKNKKNHQESVSTTEMNSDDYETTTSELEDDISTTVRPEEDITTTGTVKKRGYWKLVKLRKVVDEFETAESQNIGIISANSFTNEFDKDKVDGEEKINTASKAENENEDFLNSLYITYGLTTIKPENETVTVPPEPLTATNTEDSSAQLSSSEVPTTSTPIMPEELEITTTEDSVYVGSESVDLNLDDATVKEDENIVETSTSTSTEISQKTEICFRGVCINSNEMK